MYANGLQYIRLATDRVVLKRGINELLLSGPDVGSLIEALLPLLNGENSSDEIAERFPAPSRHDIRKLLATLLHRRIITLLPAMDVDGSPLDHEPQPSGDSDPHRARSGNPQRVRCRARTPAAECGLLAD